MDDLDIDDWSSNLSNDLQRDAEPAITQDPQGEELQHEGLVGEVLLQEGFVREVLLQGNEDIVQSDDNLDMSFYKIMDPS